MPLPNPGSATTPLVRKYRAPSDAERDLLERLMRLSSEGHPAANVGPLDPWAAGLPGIAGGGAGAAGTGGGGVAGGAGAAASLPSGAMYGAAAPPGAVGRAQDQYGNFYWYGLGDVFNAANPYYRGANFNAPPGVPAKWDPTFGWRIDWETVVGGTDGRAARPGFISGEGDHYGITPDPND